MATLFISDLHLDGTRPEITDQFIDFLTTTARTVERLYILGDLFEVWIGDDDPDGDKVRVRRALRELTTGGTACYVLHGNRDFLLGKHFCAATGCQLIKDGTVISVAATRVLLLHGDTLCTDDHAYQRLRRIVRNPLVQWVFRRLSLKRREALAARMRMGSKAHLNSVTPEIMDVNEAAVSAAFVSADVDVMIHGHTHRPGVHRLKVLNRTRTRIVLGDWHDQGSALRWDEQGYELMGLPRQGQEKVDG